MKAADENVYTLLRMCRRRLYKRNMKNRAHLDMQKGIQSSIKKKKKTVIRKMARHKRMMSKSQENFFQVR